MRGRLFSLETAAERKGKERRKGGSNILRRRWETEVGGYFFTPPSLHQEEWRGKLGDFLHKRRIMLSTYKGGEFGGGVACDTQEGGIPSAHWVMAAI